jgi:DNA-binding NarL/FixJ family response regulator
MPDRPPPPVPERDRPSAIGAHGAPSTADRTSTSLRVVVVDDQQLVRSGFSMILSVEPGIEVVGEASDGRAAIELVERLRPDLVLMDVQMPVMDGIEATREIASCNLGRVIILTTFDRDDYLIDALRAGASGFLLKNAEPERLIDAVRVVGSGHALLAPEVTRRVIEKMTSADSAAATGSRYAGGPCVTTPPGGSRSSSRRTSSTSWSGCATTSSSWPTATSSPTAVSLTCGSGAGGCTDWSSTGTPGGSGRSVVSSSWTSTDRLPSSSSSRWTPRTASSPRPSGAAPSGSSAPSSPA